MTPSLTQIRDHLQGVQFPTPSDYIGQFAAVALIFREMHDEPEILLIRRADREGDPWSGHIAFPGGRMELGDSSTQATAERETLEEIGLDLTQHGECLGNLEPEFPAKRSLGAPLLVVPYIYTLDGEPDQFMLNHEVAELHWVKISPMLRHRNLTKFKFEHEGRSHSFPGFDINGHTLWGMSFRMLNRVFCKIDANFQSLD